MLKIRREHLFGFAIGVAFATALYFAVELHPTDGFLIRFSNWLKYWDTLITGGLAAFAAFLLYGASIEQSRSAQKSANKLATIKLVNQWKDDPKRKAAQALLLKIVQDWKLPVDQRSFSKDYDKMSDDVQSALRYLMNTFEMWGVGVKAGAYDAKVFDKILKTTIVRTWTLFKPTVLGMRKTDPTVYLNVEFLVETLGN